MILAIKTDQPEAELYLFKDQELVAEYSWLAGRELSSSLMIQIEEFFNKNAVKIKNLNAVIVYEGPGSFTGLRIGTTVANSIAYSLDIPVFASGGLNWAQQAIDKIKLDKFTIGATPVYGAPVNITKQRK